MPIKDCEELTAARAVWDFTTGDPRRFLDRVQLMLLAARRFREHGVTPQFVVLLHGPATRFAARDFAGTKFAGEDAEGLPEIHAALVEFTTLGGRIEVCEIAMQRSQVGRDSILPFVELEENVFLNSIALQNRGYAYVLVA
jgi:intracellular sulfur oxidation DsrE/DsrF family protein